MSANDRNAEHNRRVVVEVGQMFSDVFTGIVEEATRSIVDGSEITGAPGQPVGQYGPGYHNGQVGGYLKSSWQTVYESPSSATIGTNTEYAESIEDGLSYAHGGTPMQLRSSVGGFYSVRLTEAGMDKIKAAVVQRVNAARGKA